MFSSFHPLNWQKHHSIISFTSTKSRAFFVPEDLEVLEEHATKHRCRRNIPRIPGHRGQSPDKGDGESKDGTQCGGTCWLTLGFKQKNISKYYWCLFWCIFCPPPQNIHLIGFSLNPTCGWRSQASEISSLCAWESTLEVEVPVEVVQPMAFRLEWLGPGVLIQRELRWEKMDGFSKIHPLKWPNKFIWNGGKRDILSGFVSIFIGLSNWNQL